MREDALDSGAARPGHHVDGDGDGSGTATALLNQTAYAAGKVLGHLRTVEWTGPELDDASQVRTRSVAVRRIDPRSVAGLTAFLAGVAMLTLWTATLLVWVIGSVSGVVGGAERFLHDIGFTGFHFMSTPVIGGMLVASAAAVLGVTAFTTLMAVAYNCYAATLGYVKIEVDDGDVPVAAPSP
jgi:hypothetical protein